MTDDKTTPKLVRTRVVAAQLGVVPGTVRNKALRLRARGIKVGTLVEGYWKYSPADIELIKTDMRLFDEDRD